MLYALYGIGIARRDVHFVNCTSGVKNPLTFSPGCRENIRRNFTEAPMTTLLASDSLGRDLRALRRSRGMTLTEVSSKLGRSVGWLSQVERDISEPTFGEVQALAEVFGVSLSTFFSQAPAKEGEENHIVRAGARRKIGQRARGLVEELLSPDLTDDFEVVHSTFAPGAARTDPVERPTQEVGYIISGRLNLTIGGQTYRLTAGDSFRIRNEPFTWANPGQEPCVAIWVIAPPVY